MTDLVPVDKGGDEPTLVAAYGSYPSLKSVIQRMSENGIPPVLDRSFFGAQSGSLTAQQRGSLRFLGLIDSEFKPTPILRALVDADDEATMKQILRETASRVYAPQIALASVNGTQGQLAETFRATGISGTTVDRAIAFYLTLAEDLELPISSHFRRVAASVTARPRKRKATKSPNSSSPLIQADKIESAVRTADSQRASYVEMLMQLAQSADSAAQKDLLDRIERALGLAVPGGNEGGN